MVKFGQTIEDAMRPEWAEGYVGYKKLKKLLKAMHAAGTTREFSEHTVYRAISVASASNLLQPDAPREADFSAAIDAEIDKVNAFTAALQKQLLEELHATQLEHAAWTAAGADASGLEALNLRMRECEASLQRFEEFINLNYLAFSKILKKHDKLSTCPCRAPYLLRIQRETFARQCLPELIKGISDMQSALQAPSSGDADRPQFDANQKGGTTFTRSTRKYWVATADVLKVKTFLLRHLPVYKFTEGLTDSDLVTSIYFDSPRRTLYEGRLKKFDGAIAVRVRWYGPMPADGETVFMERKVHREDWFGEGRQSTKERFPLRADEVVPLMEGSLSPEVYGERLEARDFRGSVAGAVALAAEVQATAQRLRLRPSLRTHYLRTAFQRAGDASVRVSLDTDLCMGTEVCSPGEWRRSEPITSLSEVTHFPHAVLELKLQLAGDDPQPPAWVQELLDSGCLVDAPKFSKFVHGTAALYRHRPSDGYLPVRELPYWWGADVRVLWEFADGASSVRGLLKRKQGDNGSVHGRNRLGIANGHTASGDEPPLLEKLRELFETIVTCGGPKPSPAPPPPPIFRPMSP